MTDNEWSRVIFRPKRSKYEAQFAEDKGFIWAFKRDWYDLDRLYLKEHPDFSAFRIFSSVGDFRDDGLPYYPEDAYTRQIGCITRFYREFDGDLDYEYIYLTKREMDSFVEEALGSIEADLAEKGFIAI